MFLLLIGWIFLATRLFIEWVREYNPDVIHLHNIHGYYINIDVLFRYLKSEFQRRVIWTFHDCWVFTGHTPYCDSVNCERWKEGCYDCPLIKEYPKAYIDNSRSNWQKKKIFQGVNNMTIITPSKWLKALAEQSFLSEYKVKVINNGIDIDQFVSDSKMSFKKKYEIEHKTMLLSVATIWDKMKGYSDFIKLSKMLNSEKYQLVLVGLTKKQLEEIPDNIIGVERTSSVQELANIYSEADLYLNLSYCENYPTVNIEAMSCGTVVLSYETGGNTEIIKKWWI